ncbi:MAG: ATP-binding protein [Fibrobacterota bacterium]|nr:MAG: ATP-binding protein [Fibrobacterota bacterium]
MKYADLIQFEQIEEIVQLLDANRPEEAKRLVSTYVISDDMADRIASSFIPQLSFDEGVDHKGILVVGNYGTGKSHLMSVVSLLAEDAGYLSLIRNTKVIEAAKSIAGKFKVHRIEVSSKMTLREIVTQQLESFLERLGVNFTFPPVETVVNNKGDFEKMMSAFAEVYPDQGLLLVVDEFLEYLRSRKDHDLVLDLSFLRELGEVTKHLRFRFVAGVQEAIFDSSRFQHVSDSLRRVNERFTQIFLARQDVSFVVSERLLKKTVDQQTKIREYLAHFAPFYGSMNERMDDYVRLFPVHPEYIGTFERLVFSEKRGALATLRDQIQAILEEEVPTDRLGILSYDKFWGTITRNSALRADTNINPVLKVSEVLQERIQKAFTRPAYKAMALRVVQGLSVHRLTTGGDIYVAVGPTAEELRDTLCLFQPGIEDMGGEPAADLLTQVQTVLREILKTVNGQFISKAPDTEQYYLDLKKDIDYDAQIEKRADALSDDALDRSYYNAIKQLMERTDEAAYVTGHQIWQVQIEWLDRRAERNGYLFFGSPNDRPTAQPERDFYLYFIQPYDPSRFKDESRSDEVFFRLKDRDSVFDRHVATFAAAQDLAAMASGGAKTIYLERSKDALRQISKWLQDKQLTAIEVTHQGKKKPLQEWIKGVSLREKLRLGPDDRANFRDIIQVVAGIALGQQFEENAPDYPRFTQLVSEGNRKLMISNALRALAGGNRTKEATAILDALELLDGDRIDSKNSRYAKEVLSRLQAKGHGQVLNRSELVSGGGEIEYFHPLRARLEPDLLMVVLGALVHSGDLVLSIAGDKIDSTKLNLLAERSLEDLKQFKHLEPPKEINVAVLRGLFEFLELAPGLAQLATQGKEEAVKELQAAVNKLVHRILGVNSDLQGRLSLWGKALLSDEQLRDSKTRLDVLKSFTEGLNAYNTLGKLKNLRTTQDDLELQKRNLDVLIRTEYLVGVVQDLSGLASYLAQAEMVLDPTHEWVGKAQSMRTSVLDALVQDTEFKRTQELKQQLSLLKRDYVLAYTSLHTKARLGVSEDKSVGSLRKDPRLGSLRILTGISLMPTSQLNQFENRLSKLKSCASLIESELAVSTICPHCQFRPTQEQLDLPPSAILRSLDGDLDQLLASWQTTLLENLQDPTVQDAFGILKPSARDLVQAFIGDRKLSAPITPEFVQAAQDALSGLVKVVLTKDDIKTALVQGGSPATPEELRRRFEQLIADRSKGQDNTKLRFVVD